MLLLLVIGQRYDRCKRTCEEDKIRDSLHSYMELSYNAEGLEGLLSDKNGGDKRSDISAEQKKAIKARLSRSR